MAERESGSKEGVTHNYLVKSCRRRVIILITFTIMLVEKDWDTSVHLLMVYEIHSITICVKINGSRHCGPSFGVPPLRGRPIDMYLDTFISHIVVA